MSAPSALPVIIVSAKSEDTANNFITELIDNEPPDSPEAGAGVWRIVNKYYTADVRLVPLADGAPPPPPHTVEGHVIYLAEDEMSVERGEARCGAGAAAQVRVVACAAAALPGAVSAWAARRRLEPVALHDPGAGLAAARAALHAHVWPGLVRHPPPPLAAAAAAAEGPEWGAWVSHESAAWAAALGALQGVRALPPAERRAAAEGLVAAVCRALGEDL